jgi:hypothetical protein
VTTRTYTVRLTELEVRAVQLSFSSISIGMGEDIKIVGLVLGVSDGLQHTTLRTLNLYATGKPSNRYRVAARRVWNKLFNAIKEAGGDAQT